VKVLIETKRVAVSLSDAGSADPMLSEALCELLTVFEGHKYHPQHYVGQRLPRTLR
jgi:hypothetical protein